MEWQLVTGFFANMNKKGGTKFEHPDPRQGNKLVDFCTFWIESWGPQKGPELTEFTISNSAELTPWGHISAAYPSRYSHTKEMFALQKQINSPAKANVSIAHVRHGTFANSISFSAVHRLRSNNLDGENNGSNGQI